MKLGWAGHQARTVKTECIGPQRFRLHRNPMDNIYVHQFPLVYAARDRIIDKTPGRAPDTLPRPNSFTLDVYGFAITTESVGSRYGLTTKDIRLYLVPKGWPTCMSLSVSFLCACRHHTQTARCPGDRHCCEVPPSAAPPARIMILFFSFLIITSSRTVTMKFIAKLRTDIKRDGDVWRAFQSMVRFLQMAVPPTN